MPEETLVLDRNRCKVLASQTRVAILKALDRRRLSLSEVAGECDLALSTVHEQMTHLVEAGFVVSENDGHRWVYYALTPDGKAILHPNKQVKVLVVLATAALTVFAGLSTIALYLYDLLGPKDLGWYQDGDANLSPLIVGIALLAIGGLLGYLAFCRRRGKISA
ncbi:ArsR/SmtB family transcription factor [Methanofollis ethanolicus]|uniref:ArsR/SmtB family transcription factor n=1 Tax=Methanofollis ethanolicus TaxID=488124 RepID=UPI00082E8D4F|nr:winged helix-turn-helix domain-containing protein [Methanofollis ethanolicus]